MQLEPRIRVSAVLRWRDRVLLCRHEKHGREYWLLPGGVMALVCPEEVVDDYSEVRRHLMSYYAHCTIMPFPVPSSSWQGEQ